MPSTKRVSHRGLLLKGVAVYRVLYQSILNAKLTGRKNLGRKRCTSNRDDWKLENTVKQSWFKHLWELHKEWTEAGVSASRVTMLRRLQEKGYQATSEPETTSEASYLGCGEKELSGPKSSFQMKVNFAFHLEIKVPESGGRVGSRACERSWAVRISAPRSRGCSLPPLHRSISLPAHLQFHPTPVKSLHARSNLKFLCMPNTCRFWRVLRSNAHNRLKLAAKPQQK